MTQLILVTVCVSYILFALVLYIIADLRKNVEASGGPFYKKRDWWRLHITQMFLFVMISLVGILVYDMAHSIRTIQPSSAVYAADHFGPPLFFYFSLRGIVTQ